jgi:hypothetical protein
MSFMFSMTSMLPLHLATEMSMMLRIVVEILSTEMLGVEMLGVEALGGLRTLFSTVFDTAFTYPGIQQSLRDGRSPNCDNLRLDWLTVERKHYDPRSTRDGLTPALA